MTKKRVLRIQSRICVGGPALNTINLSAHLNSEKYQTLLVGGALEPGEKSMEPLAESKGVAVHHIPEMGRSVSWRDDLRALRKLIKLMRLYRPDIVHTHTAKAGALGRIAAFLCRVPLRVHTFHGHVFHGYFSPFVNRLVIWTERFLCRLNHITVAISPKQKSDLTETFKVVPSKRCEIVRLGFELDRITGGTRGRFRASLGMDDSIRLVGILARLVPIKNHKLFFEAVSVWVKQHSQTHSDQVKFLVIGDGELRQELEQLAETLNIVDWIVFTGWRRDVADIYADLDLNVLVSRNEGTPVTLIEGMACGVPLVSTDVGGIRDFTDEHCGRIVSADASPEQVAEAMQHYLIKPRSEARLSEAIRQQIHNSFGVSRLVADMERLYASRGQ
jgi:glycosyltransferase involved in cell wall biosynthesis